MSVAAAVVRSFRRMPDFAGVALVDILANGVAMLIIVIVLSIAARMEREERYAEQTSEIAAVMSHKFSTSLVLNSLAASRPARLHDYDASPLDRILDPAILPILELHAGFVREFYTGTIWTRRELLEERSGLGAWVAGFGEEQRRRLRVDVYDIPQFYLAMSILREHGIRVYHWHFLTGALTPDEAVRCPPGVAAKDCVGGGSMTPAPLPRLALDEGPRGGLGDRDAPRFEAPRGSGSGTAGEGDLRGSIPDGAGATPGLMPGGVVPGWAGSEQEGFASGWGPSGAAEGGMRSGGAGSDPGGARGEPGGGEPGTAGAGRGLLPGSEAVSRTRGFGSEPGFGSESAAGLGSFPNALEGGSRSDPGAGPARAPRFNLRIALPESLRRAAQSGNPAVRTPALEALFAIILHYLGELQDSLDSGGAPSRLVDGFAERMQRAFRSPLRVSEAERRIARDLARDFALTPLLGDPAFRPEPLPLRPAPPAADADAVLVIAPNRLIDELGVGRGGSARSDRVPEWGRASFALNAYPGIFKGLEIRIEPYSVLLLPPEARNPERLRWRAAAYVTPALDDVIVGFAFASLDGEGRLRIQADANRVRLDGRPLFTEYRESAFGSRGWLVSLYAALVAGLLLIAAGRRHLAGGAA